MRPQNEKQLLSSIAADKFVGRFDQIERLYLHAVSGAEPFRVQISAPPGSGTSELLRKVYDRLFHEQRFVVPFYFALRPGDHTAHSAAARYAYQFLLQAIAFRRNDPDIIRASPDLCELAKLAPMSDAERVERMCEVCQNDGPLNDERGFIRSALAAPMRASAGRMRVCVIVDDLHEAVSIEGGSTFIGELMSLSANARAPLMVGTRRRFRLPESDFETFTVNALNREECAILIEILSSDLGIAIGEQARDLIAVKFSGNIELIRAFLFTARDKVLSLDGYRDVEQLYVDELFGGRIGGKFDGIFKRATRDHGIQEKLTEALYSSVEPEANRFRLDVLRDRIGFSVSDFDMMIECLELDEILAIESGFARLIPSNLLRDYLESRHRSARGVTTAAATAYSVTNALKRAPREMARVYRNEASIGLKELLSSFDIRVVPRGVVDYRVFRDKYKGIPEDQIRMQIAEERETVALPQIVHASSIKEHFPEFGEPIEPERAVVGIGFTDRSYRDEDQIAWLAVEIDSKLEADHSVTLEWCDRLSAAAAACGFPKFRIWMIAPEGFSDGALDLLSERNGFGSSKRQVELLRKYLNYDEDTASTAATEYEIVIPIGDETELIAAHTLEEIARRYDFPTKAVNQIKTALVEACINAAEHSLSPDRKIYQKFAVDAEKIVITVSNRGLRLADKIAAKPALETAPGDSRRGWGLNLIRGLMDDVQLESVDDGTRIVMTKYLRT